ncbi:MAG: extensin family protein [Hyphomicrobiales bacterium]|nr:extensin family protein [Hyphomicrobiales bacterium]
MTAKGQAVAEKAAPVVGERGCGIAAPVLLRAVVLADGRKIALAPAPLMRCELATSVASWLAEDVVPVLETEHRRVARIDDLDAYDCRGRNKQPGAKLSEHGVGDAIDFAGVSFAGGGVLRFADKGNDINVATLLRTSACVRFTTVLGPGSDGFHESHVHLDLEARRHGGRICQWSLR